MSLPPQEAVQVVARLLEILESLARNAQTAMPEVNENLTDGRRLALVLFSGTQDLFDSIRTLLAEGYGEQASILQRTLFEDATTLQYLAENSDRLEELALNFLYTSMGQERGLIEEGISYGMTVLEQKRPEIEARAERLRGRAKELGVKLRKVPQLQGAPRGIGPTRNRFRP